MRSGNNFPACLLRLSSSGSSHTTFGQPKISTGVWRTVPQAAQRCGTGSCGRCAVVKMNPTHLLDAVVLVQQLRPQLQLAALPLGVRLQRLLLGWQTRGATGDMLADGAENKQTQAAVCWPLNYPEVTTALRPQPKPSPQTATRPPLLPAALARLSLAPPSAHETLSHFSVCSHLRILQRFQLLPGSP